MSLTTAIFDMDGLIVDSEPLWYEAAIEVLNDYKIELDQELYNTSIGLRTKEFLHHWFTHFNINISEIPRSEKRITDIVIAKVENSCIMMEGVHDSIELIKKKNFKIGLASSSPISLIETVVRKTGLNDVFTVKKSAELLPFGKPHPQVFLECAEGLESKPTECFCLEDSFNGLIAAKGARMKCIIVPHPDQFNEPRWNAADLKLKTLKELTSQHLTDLVK
jgi:beta-phosphoglucomutase-like phosphatase (HAD superfamily)